MRKKIAMALSMLLMMVMLGACGTDPTTVDYNGHSYSDLETESYQNVSAVAQLAAFITQNGLTEADMTKDLYDALASSYGFTEEQIDAAIVWNNVVDEFGEIQAVDDESFKVEKAGNTLTTDIILEFEKRDVDFQVVYTYYSMEISGITIEPVYSLSEKMAKAGMNTVISISIVFCVLILISLIIACFNIFPYIEKKKAEKKAANTSADVKESVVEEAAVAAPVVPAAVDDTELIAVIAAAIAASTGTSTSDFVVRSINRR